jgi:hypothetical protein
VAGGRVRCRTAAVSGATYRWTGPNGFTANIRNVTIDNATPDHAGEYFVTVTVNGCTSAPGSTEVEVNSMDSPAAFNNGPICEGENLELSTPTVENATYSWTGPNGFTSTQQNPLIPGASPLNAGIYEVTITVDDCTSSA